MNHECIYFKTLLFGIVAIFVRGRGQIFLGEIIPVLVRDFNATE